MAIMTRKTGISNVWASRIFSFLADISRRTIANESQLLIHYAAKYNAIDCFDLLLEYGADPLAEDGSGQTPMFLAAQFGKLYCLYNLSTLIREKPLKKPQLS